jgi:acetolactate synthase-1/2/3 large subunit
MDADQYEIYRPFCKRVYRVDRVQDLPRIVERAFHLAVTGRPGPVLVDIPMDIFSADLPAGSFHQVPAAVSKPALDPAMAESVAQALSEAKRPLLYAGGGVLSSHASAELQALAETLEIPVAHTLMGKGCLKEDHPLLLGMTGFWGTPVANTFCREADLILATGTRLAEANSSSWDPRFTFSFPPTRLIHIDIDPAEIGRNFPTESGAVADAKLARRDCRGRQRKTSRRQTRPARGDRQRPRGIFVAVGSPMEFGPISAAPRKNSQRTS